MGRVWDGSLGTRVGSREVVFEWLDGCQRFRAKGAFAHPYIERVLTRVGR